MNKKSILFINRRIGFNRGGGEQSDLSLANELQEKGYSIFFLIGGDTHGNIKVPFNEYPHKIIESPYLVDIWQKMPFPFSIVINYIDTWLFEKAVFKQIDNIIKEWNIDTIELLSLCDLSYELQKNYPDINVVTQFPGPLGRFFYLNSMRKLKNLFANGDGYSQLSKLNKNVRNIPLGINPNHFKKIQNTDDVIRKRHGIPSQFQIILSVARLVPLKNYPYVLQALRAMKKNKADFVYLIVGEGPEREKLQNLIDAYDLKDNVRLIGPVINNDLLSYYNAADIFILASSYESFGIVLLEAMSCGLPVIATDVGGMRQIVKPDYNGFLVQLNHPQSFAQTINKVLTNDTLRYDLSKNAISSVREYTWERVANLYERYYLT